MCMCTPSAPAAHRGKKRGSGLLGLSACLCTPSEPAVHRGQNRGSGLLGLIECLCTPVPAAYGGQNRASDLLKHGVTRWVLRTEPGLLKEQVCLTVEPSLQFLKKSLKQYKNSS